MLILDVASPVELCLEVSLQLRQDLVALLRRHAASVQLHQDGEALTELVLKITKTKTLGTYYQVRVKIVKYLNI